MTRLVAGGMLGGFGLAMLFDSLVLHQILQWHHSFSRFGPMPADDVVLLADTIFELSAWAVSGAGLVILLTEGVADVWPRQDVTRWALVGWGAAVLLDCAVNHRLLGIHHVRDGVANTLAYDVGYLVFAGIFPLLVALLLWAARPAAIRLALPQRA
ncbi:MAG: DUF2243 domain-containing protein [Candidatus Methylomirabilales bacterium]